MSILAIICAMDMTNGGLYASPTQTYGTREEAGAFVLTSIESGPPFSMIILGATGAGDTFDGAFLASIPISSRGRGRVPRLLTCGDAIAGSGWPASFRNGGRHQIGTLAGFISESVAGFNRNPQTASNDRHGPRRWITSALNRPLMVSARALS